MKGVLPWLVRGACCAGQKDFCSALAALVGPVQNIIFLAVHYFTSFVPIAQQARQAVMPRRLSPICVLGDTLVLSRKQNTDKYVIRRASLCSMKK
jgi:hypothetical protein